MVQAVLVGETVLTVSSEKVLVKVLVTVGRILVDMLVVEVTLVTVLVLVESVNVAGDHVSEAFWYVER